MRAQLCFGLLAMAIVGAGLASARPAFAGGGNADVCENGTDPDLIIAACTPIIESGGTKELSLELALDDRCSALNDIANYDLALEDCNTAIRLNPNFTRTYNNRGNAYAGMERYDQAIEDYDSAIRRNPRFEFAYYNRGLAHEVQGDYAQAIKDYTAAIRVNPNDPDDYTERCYSYAIIGEVARAISDCDRSLQLIPRDASIVLDSRGYAYLRAGDLDSAIADYDAALRLNPSIPNSLFGRGVANARKGRWDEGQHGTSRRHAPSTPISTRRWQQLILQRPRGYSGDRRADRRA